MEMYPAVAGNEEEHDVQSPLVQEQQVVGAKQGHWGASARFGALALGLLCAFVVWHSAPDAAASVVHGNVRGAVIEAAADDDADSEDMFDDDDQDTGGSALDLERDMLDDLPIYTDEVGPGKDPHSAKVKTWTIVSKHHHEKYEERQKHADAVFKEPCDVVFVAKAIPLIIVQCTLAELRKKMSGHTEHFEMVEQEVKDEAIPLLPAGVQRRLGAEQQDPPSWGLDRSDQRDLPLAENYQPKIDASHAGKGVHVYVLDTGIRTTHSDFQGRAIPTLEVLSYRPKECNGDRNCANDIGGHGTHCAGTVAGFQYGVAKKANVHAVKVLGDDGGGSFGWFEVAIDWVIQNGKRPSIISASLGGKGKVTSTETAIDAAVEGGVTVVIAAGNDNDNACGYTPAFVPSAITVGSTTTTDMRSDFSNYGNCINIFAPGSDIISADEDGNSGSDKMSGTSMACPHVAGAAALILSADLILGAAMTPAQVLKKLSNHASHFTVKDAKGPLPDLLYVGGSDDEVPAPAPVPPASDSDCATNGWKVTDGDCEIDDATCCLTSPNYPSKYGENSLCTVQVGDSPGKITQKSFRTEANWDFLHITTVDGTLLKFNGDDGPHSILPQEGSTIRWTSDEFMNANGFKLCLQDMGTPCPANGWKPVPSCKDRWKYDGTWYEGECSKKDHTGGWCFTTHSGNFSWADCEQCD